MLKLDSNALRPGRSDKAMLSRRGLVRGAAALIESAAALAVSGTQVIAKMVQKSAAHQPTPNSDQSCATCALFKALASCTLVDGDIARQDRVGSSLRS